MAASSSLSPREYFNSIPTERMVAMGLALFCPAMSGAEPWMGSYIPREVADRLAEGSMPMEPVMTEASSDKMSPKMLEVTITSNCLGPRTSCMAALSTYIWDSSTSGYSAASRVTVFRHRRLLSSTLALSTLHRRLSRFLAASKATRAIRSISMVE